MGAYLSQPKTTKESTDSEGVRVRCCASSMQGWRTSQEDAHNCILDFDKDSSFFAVYDGHGGHEVAEFCSKKLPDFIKQTASYIKGEYEQALKDAYLEFDATLATPEVMAVLNEIANSGDKTNSDPGSDSEEEDAIQNLVQEAHMPLDEVMAKYKVGGPLARLQGGEGKPPVSPMLRARRTPASSSAGGSSSKEPSSSSNCAASSSSSAGGSSGDGEVSSSSSSDKAGLCNGNVHVNGEREQETEVDSSDVKTVKADSEKCDIKRTDSEAINNGESHEITSSTKNGSGDEITSSSPPKKKIPSNIEVYQKLLQDMSDSEEEDETFTAEAESEGSSDDDEEVDGTGEKEEEDEEDSSVDDEEEDEDNFSIKEVPGADSGSTAVVALLVGSQLYVANAGDSRCVVSRDRTAVEMSFDHKPEDEPEKKRIEKANGYVSADGRVNGGLNLSRAIGDHSYKKTKDLPPSEQMITALPDVKTLTIDPLKDEFMVLACDGIWNSMTSQEVVDFIHVKLDQKTERLSQICEELFDHCLAPNTMGDGTGCDNMTCVIVQFKKPSEEVSSSSKRPAGEIEEPSSKRSKVEDETQAS